MNDNLIWYSCVFWLRFINFRFYMCSMAPLHFEQNPSCCWPWTALKLQWLVSKWVQRDSRVVSKWGSSRKICMHMYVLVCMCMYMYVHMRICMPLCMYQHVFVCVSVRVYLYLYMCVSSCICKVNTYIYIYMIQYKYIYDIHIWYISIYDIYLYMMCTYIYIW